MLGRGLIVGVALAVAITACSGDGDGEPTAAPSSSRPEPTPAMTDAPATAAVDPTVRRPEPTTSVPTTVAVPSSESVAPTVAPASPPVPPSQEAPPASTATTASTVPPPQPRGAEPPCTSEALDAAAGPASAHTWDDLVCVAGYAHAYLAGSDSSAPSPELVFLAEYGRWRELARGSELDGSPDLAGMPPEVLDAFQLVGPGTQPPDGAPCDVPSLAAATRSVEPGAALEDLRCAGTFARARAVLSGGQALDLLFGAGPAGWRELASAPDLAGTGAVDLVPSDLRAPLGL